MARKFIKFGIVGTASTIVSLAVFWLILLQYPQLNLVSKAIGYIMGFFVGFTLNKFWTYIDQTDDGEKYLLKYIIVYVSTFVVYLLFNFLCDHFIHPNEYLAKAFSFMESSETQAWLMSNGPLVSNILAIGLNVALNFLGTNFLVFKVPEPDKLFE
jgi:putative flippase GtrA